MGVQIETMKEGDGATFPQKGQKVFIKRKRQRAYLLLGVLPLCAHLGERQESWQLKGPWQAFPVHPWQEGGESWIGGGLSSLCCLWSWCSSGYCRMGGRHCQDVQGSEGETDHLFRHGVSCWHFITACSFSRVELVLSWLYSHVLS